MPKEKKEKKEKKETREKKPTSDYILETNAAPENSEKEDKIDRKNRLRNKRQAKFKHYQRLEEGDAGPSGPSTRTRSKTKTLSDTREKTKEGYNVGKIDIECKHCGALRWKREKPGLCCINSQVILAPLQAPPPEIYYLLTAKDPISKVPFFDKIRAYNQAFAFISIATDLDLDVANEKKGAYCYRIQGDHYHQINSALPKQREIPKLSQIYFHDSSDIEVQIDRRHDVMKQSLNRNMINIIQNVLMDLNPFVDTYISAGNENLQNPLYYILIYNKHGKDMRQYNTPLVKEVAAICFSNKTMHVRDILIVRYDNELERIYELHGAYNPLAYPLLFLLREYALKKKMTQNPEASKTSEAEAESSGTSNIDFNTLLKRESQSQTGLSNILEFATIRSSSSMSLNDENIDTDDKEYFESRTFVKKGKKRAREETEKVQAQAEDDNNLYDP
ncbi:10120_t:CDS:2, partial [Dentiscutata erythropus]